MYKNIIFLFVLFSLLSPLFSKIKKNATKKIFLSFFSSVFLFLIHPLAWFFMAIFIVVNYFFSLILEKLDDVKKRLIMLIPFIIANLSGLYLLKYKAQMIFESLPYYYEISYFFSHIFICVGVSFYVLQCLSYLFDIAVKEESKGGFLDFYTYISFFPKIYIGPIERFRSFSHQIESKFSNENIHNTKEAFILFFEGLLKKIIIADPLGIITRAIFGDYSNHSTYVIFLGMVLYSFRIYFDFAGYTNMAQGLALLFNIRLQENFKQPFFSNTYLNFWRNWHVTFFNWIVNYIFKPSMFFFKKRLKLKWAFILSCFIAFLLAWAWHSVKLNYLIYGFLQGVIYTLALYIERKRKALKKKPLSDFIKIPLIFFTWTTTNILVIFPSFETTKSFIFYFFSSFNKENSQSLTSFLLPINAQFYNNWELIVCLFMAFGFIIYDGFVCLKKYDIQKAPVYNNNTVLLIILFVIIQALILFSRESSPPFIYLYF